MKNEKIGTLGEAFIQKLLGMGIEFEPAWDDWQRIHDKLKFIIVDCPEVKFYDHWQIGDRAERLRIRRLAKAKLGKHIRSRDVSLLGHVAAWLEAEIPSRPYHMDRQVVTEWLALGAETLEMKNGLDENTVKAKRLANCEEEIEEIAVNMEKFATDHSLWSVPNNKLVGLYVDHRHCLLETTYTCAKCKEETTIPVDHSSGSWQHFTVACPSCDSTNEIYMSIDKNGEASVLCALVQEPAE